MDQIHDMALNFKQEFLKDSQELKAIATKAKLQQLNRVISELEILITIQVREEQEYVRYLIKHDNYSNVIPLLTYQLTESTEMLNKLRKISANSTEYVSEKFRRQIQ